MDESSYNFYNSQTEYEEQNQNNAIQMENIHLESLEEVFMILGIINNQLGLSYSTATQMNYFRSNQYQRQEILSQYQINDEFSNVISSYIKSDGSFAFLLNVFCSSETIEQILFSIKSKISYVYYDGENFNILLIIDSKYGIIGQKKTEYLDEQFQSQQIPLETFLQTKFQNQQKILNKLGLTNKKQLRNFLKIKNERLKVDLIELFKCLDEDLLFQNRSFNNEFYAYYTQSKDLNLLEGLIIGPQGTPFEGLVYTLKIRIPDQYPYEPPQITFNKQITHQNINVHGELHLDTLMNQWTSILTLQEILINRVNLLKQSDYVNSIRIPYQENTDFYKMLLRQEYVLQQNQNICIDYQEIQEQVKQQQLDIERYYQEYDDSYIPDLEYHEEYIE
ncbi:hypothetical protein ABPG72_006263 [Tetrahymena utriculariae]